MSKQAGFTLVELLVVVVIIGILAAISLANYSAAAKKSKNAAIMASMRTLQICSEAYSTDSGGTYSPNANGPFLNYLPTGSMSMLAGPAGTIPLNPLTGQTSIIADAGIATSVALQNLRAQVPAAGAAMAGSVAYSQVDVGLSYAVTGTDVSGLYIPKGGGTLVLSNQ